MLLVDDLTETAGTLTSAAAILKKHGARNIYAGVAHAVLVDVAIPRLQKSQITELVTTNSTPVRTVEGFKATVLCVSELLGEGIKRIHNDESVSSLFNIENENKWQNKLNLKQNRAPDVGRSAVRKLKSARIHPGGHLRRQRQTAAAASLRARHQRDAEPRLRRKRPGRARNRRRRTEAALALVQEVQHCAGRRRDSCTSIFTPSPWTR